MAAPKTDTAFPWVGLFTLAGAIFVCVTSEFLPTGLLPEMAEGLGVSQSQVGLLVAVFAGTVVVSAAPLAALTRRLPRKPLILVVLVAFALSNFIVAVAPSYEVVLAARVLGGLAHGLFWAVVGAYPGHLVTKGQLARAVAITSAGGSAAFVLGIPAGTALGHLLGWRLAFSVVGAVILVLAVLVLRLLPPVDHRPAAVTGELSVPLRKDPSILGVVFVCVITLLVMTGHNLYYTYIVPFFTVVNGFPDDAVSLLLLVYGLAGAAGLLLVGLFGGRFPRVGLLVSTGAIVAAVLTIGLLPREPIVVVVALAIWGTAFGGAPALLQTRVLQTASRQLRDVASAFVTTSFNIGIGGGALVGSLLLEGYGLEALPFADAVVTGAVVLVLLVSGLAIRRRAVALG
jgi:predicted MFS family arabinose efflux permease